MFHVNVVKRKQLQMKQAIKQTTEQTTIKQAIMYVEFP